MATFRTRKSGAINVQVRTKSTKASMMFQARAEDELWALQLELSGSQSDLPTFSSIKESYLGTMKDKPSLAVLTVRYNNLIKFMGNKPIQSITSVDAYDYMNHRSKSVSSNTIRLEVKLFARVLKYCKRQLLMDLTNIMDLIQLPKAKKGSQEI